MASIIIKGRPIETLHPYQVWRMGSDPNDKSLDYCVDDPSVAKFHASLTRAEKGLYLVNESGHRHLAVNGRYIGGPKLITNRDATNGIVHIRFGRVEARLLITYSIPD